MLGVPRAEFQQVLSDTYDRRARGQLGAPRQMLGELCRLIGCQPARDALERAARLRVAQFREVLERPRPGVEQLFQGLQGKGVAIGLLSDCSGETPLVWPDLAWGRPVRGPVFSFVEHERKPAPRLYRLAASRLGVPPSECLFVGDGGSQELTGALAVGMEAWQLLAPRSDGESHLQYDPDPSWEGRRITDLRQVLEGLAG